MMEGYKVGLDVSTQNRMGLISCEYGHDGFRGNVHILTGTVSIPFQPEVILRGENPFSVASGVTEGDSGSSRLMRKMLAQRVRREWHQPGIVVATRTVGGSDTVTATRSPNLPLSDLATTADHMTVSGAPGTITKVTVTLNISHTFVHDAIISLRSPSGTTVILFDKNDGGADDWTGTLFDDAAATSIAAGWPPYTRTFRPIQPLSTLNGQNANGTWQLIFTDTYIRDIGTLHSWSLTIEAETPITDVTNAGPRM